MMTMTPALERQRLQIAIAILSLIPILAGLAGMVYGMRMSEETMVGAAIDSHVRYLSGLLFGIGIAFLASVPHIEQHGPRCRLLAAIIFAGGLARLGGVIAIGWPGIPMFLGLLMELIVTPLLCLWQWRVIRLLANDPIPASPDSTFQD